MSSFKLVSPYAPRGDQPNAIVELSQGINEGYPHLTLLGVTGSGKTFTMANVIAQVQKPTLIISHNKTLAAQLCSEFREFFPENAVEYFVSYYDYYQPEAYIPQSDTYIEKDSSINDEIDRLRHSATQSLLGRRDVIVVSSVSCLYGLGSPEDYKDTTLWLKVKEPLNREFLLTRLIEMQFKRNNLSLTRGEFRLRGDVLEIFPAQQELLIKVQFGDEIVEHITVLNPVSGEVLGHPCSYLVYPAVHFVLPPDKLETACQAIEAELEQRLQELNRNNKLLEAQRLQMRTRYDLELLRQVGYCNGIENYSRHLSGRQPGEPPATLIDYFPENFLVFIDESHVTLPQLHGMWAGDRSRKKNLVDYGFRLPSAYDNRPLTFEEFMRRVPQIVYVSATPAAYELKQSSFVVEQIIRPTGLVDPELEVKPTTHQVDDLIEEIRQRSEAQERTLVTTLTKKLAENLAEYLTTLGMKVKYLHSEIDTLERIEILRDLRLGVFDTLVGINLLREGLDLPEVSLVAILDADKEGFLRSETSLIQTIGRAARNIKGKVILYADNITPSIRKAIDETQRRRTLQLEYNRVHHINPESIKKAVRDILEGLKLSEPEPDYRIKHKQELSLTGLKEASQRLNLAMLEAARNLEFEKAAALRDEMFALKKEINKRFKDSPLSADLELSA